MAGGATKTRGAGTREQGVLGRGAASVDHPLGALLLALLCLDGHGRQQLNSRAGTCQRAAKCAANTVQGDAALTAFRCKASVLSATRSPATQLRRTTLGTRSAGYSSREWLGLPTGRRERAPSGSRHAISNIGGSWFRDCRTFAQGPNDAALRQRCLVFPVVRFSRTKSAVRPGQRRLQRRWRHKRRHVSQQQHPPQQQQNTQRHRRSRMK